ncbi:Cysteine/histidine-rich C1 domain protein [Rhynchospora pubera]|uniref:Cysteine/histidine-rich C1 domain protein n=1 Tax=Rhynchospora pubera TaxID=906938 RepID=A0AAV8FSS2_9POAL|nr:Cysteine/histidine-rich C1 domain protein [Rhynchospora pubera]
MCNRTIMNWHCFCALCRKCLHPTCAGVRMSTEYSNSMVLPLSCRGCLESRTTRGSVVRNLVFNFHQESFPTGLQINSSITRIIERRNPSPHQLMKCDDYCLIHENSQGHNLVVRDDQTVCNGCKEKIYGPHNACENSCCSFRLHQECTSPRTTIMHPFFQGIFVFSSAPTAIAYGNPSTSRKKHCTFSCNACGRDVNGYYYYSLNGEIRLHPCCALLPRQITCGETGANMVLLPQTTAKCLRCNHTRMLVNNKKTDQIWSYVSPSENVHMHVRCIIEMTSELEDHSIVDNRVICRVGRLTLCKKTIQNGVTKLELQIAASGTRRRWEQKFGICTKFVKIAFGAIISAFFGDPTSFITNTYVAFAS